MKRPQLSCLVSPGPWRVSPGDCLCPLNLMHLHAGLTGSIDSTIRCWDCRSRKPEPIQTLDEARDGISSVKVSDHEVLAGWVGPGPCRSPGATEVHSCLCAWIKKSTLLIVLIGPAWSGLCCALRFYMVVVQMLSLVQLFSTPCTVALQASLSFTVFRSLLKLVSIESVVPSNPLILCRTLLLPSILPSIRVFSNESALCIKWPKYCS